MGRFPSGQRGQTVNLLAFAFDGSNPSLPIPPNAEVAQLVEQHLDMVEVVGSSPIPRIPFDLSIVDYKTLNMSVFLFIPSTTSKESM